MLTAAQARELSATSKVNLDKKIEFVCKLITKAAEEDGAYKVDLNMVTGGDPNYALPSSSYTTPTLSKTQQALANELVKLGYKCGVVSEPCESLNLNWQSGDPYEERTIKDVIYFFRVSW